MSEPELCRLCAESKENFIGIYDAEGQKLEIEAKIAKCLQIRVLINDGLPLSICIDCCVLLNQSSEFFEKTNQAQVSLRQLLVESKSETRDLEPSVNYEIKGETEYLKDETVNRLSDNLRLSEDYISNAVNDIGETYFNGDHQDNTNDKYDSDEITNEEKPKKSKVHTKRNISKPGKKKVKRKAQAQKLEDLEFDLNSDAVKIHNLDKNNIKIPDNYMTGTESDIEMVGIKTIEQTKTGRKKDEMERYPWLCTDCNDKLPSLETLEQHHETVHNQLAKYMCVQCCKVYDKYYGFLSHVKRHKNKAKFNCEDCGKSFVHKKVLESHKAMHSEEWPHVCQTCGKAFRQQSALFIHSRCHLPDTMKNRFPCDQCDKRFSTKPNLVTHKRIHSGVRNFTCDQCGKSFIQKGNLEAHFLTHSADKPYSCSQCPKAFKTPLQLKKHETVHTGAKPHQCAVCGRTFREKGTLREHHRIHTGAMPFTCEFCGKSFRFKGILTTHRRQHTGERPYSCLECQHHFTNWPNYNKHMKRRHGINTSHTKHLPRSHNQIQLQDQQQHPPQSQATQNGTSEDQLAIPHSGNTQVQVIQSVSHSDTTQPIVVQTIPTTTIPTFQADVSGNVQDTVFRERNTTYFNSVPTALQNFLPPNLSYNFYNISNVTENDLIQHR
ncbi:zinc finger protein 626-like [Prorops nasuta]|uniref:zinc finger protein 626-like n=1 Tax=Prorops nasuta TaxID=863751 RepID=UPI0034CE4FBB